MVNVAWHAVWIACRPAYVTLAADDRQDTSGLKSVAVGSQIFRSRLVLSLRHLMSRRRLRHSFGTTLDTAKCRHVTPPTMTFDEWINHTANCVQVAVCEMEYCSHSQDLERTWQRFVTPRTELEELFARGLLSTTTQRVLSRCGYTDAHTLLAIITASPLASLRLVIELYVLRRAEGPAQSMREMKAFVDSHYSEPITASMLSKRFRVTAKGVNDTFVRLTGISLRRYLISIRIREGAKLIESGVKVEAAALAVGYRSKGAFYHSCKRLTGTTPTNIARQRASVVSCADISARFVCRHPGR
jgi:AraC-like DNA-binding protein